METLAEPAIDPGSRGCHDALGPTLRHRAIRKARLVVAGQTDERTLELESGGDASDALAAEIAQSVRELTKLRSRFLSLLQARFRTTER